jgi:uncharacterized protein (DUF486 family)
MRAFCENDVTGKTDMTALGHPIVPTVLLLAASNLFMTFAWYGHLKHLNSKPWWIAALVSWGIALFEYLLQVPANRIGFTAMNLGQLKILQEVITLAVFVPFAILYMGQEIRMNYLYAAICLMGAVYFIFRG